jgi:dephospho-CoA kinase
MPVIGLTGLYASGKSHIAEIFKGLGTPIHDSDKAAHQLLEGEAKAAVEKEFGTADRKQLAEKVFTNETELKKLEAILHPLVRQKNLEFIKENKGNLVVLEIPLLFETKAEEICDYVIFVHVKSETQKKRAQQRHGYSDEKLARILKAQTRIPVEEKMHRADFVIENEGQDLTLQVKKIIESVGSRA